MRESRGITVLALVAVSLLGILVWFLSGDGSVPPVSDASTPADPEGRPALSAPPTSEADPATPERTPDEAPASRTQVQTDNLLTGRLVLDGRPLPGVRVEVWRDLLLPTVVHLEDALTDIEGRFSFRGLEDGIHGLLLDGLEVPRGYRLERVIITDRQDLDLGEIRIPAPGSLSGRVVDPEGQPLAGVQMLDSPGPFPRFDPTIGDIGLALFETVTDGEGRFSFEGVVSGPHQVLAASPDHADRKVAGSVDPGGHLDVGTMRLGEGMTVFGQVVDVEGAPVAGAEVVPYGAIPGQVVVGVRTGATGEFQLRGMDPGTSLRVKADGFAQKDVAMSGPDPMTIRLDRSWVLTGRVEGRQGHEALVEIRGDLRNHFPLLAPANTKSFPIGEDGSFRIEGLASSPYFVKALAEGFGVTEEKAIWPVEEPVVLTIAPYRSVNVVVRDDLGRPVGDAEVIRITRADVAPFAESRGLRLQSWIQAVVLGRSAEVIARTDPEGRAEFIQEPGHPLGLVVTHSELLPTGASFEAGAWPDPVEVVLQRAASLSGRVNGTMPGNPRSLQGRIRQVENPGSRPLSGEFQDARVDGDGGFEVERLPPGVYDVTVYSEADSIRSAQLGREGPVPILGQGAYQDTTRSVELLAGETTEVVLEAMPLGTIRGRVLRGDEPVAGVLVFGAPDSVRSSTWDREDAHSSRPGMTTGPDGSFLFLYARPGTWQLRVLHPQSPMSSLGAIVEAPAYGMEIQRDLSLSTGALRGAVDPSVLEETREEGLVAYLFSLEGASEDLFRVMATAPELDRFKAFPIRAGGSFVFPFVPEGEWVLRLISGRSRIVLQTRVRTEPDTITDLGTLTLPESFDVDLLLDLSDEIRPMLFHCLRITVRRTVPGRESGIFVRSIPATSGRVRLEDLEPGTYEFQFEGGTRRTLVVHADGTAEPSVLSFR